MKRYQLVKDLPTFKAGEVFEIEEDGSLFRIDHTGDGSGRVMAYHKHTLDKFPNILEEWFEPIEYSKPLIKDEKIRAIFKMWADNFKNAMIDGTFTFYVDREYHSFTVNLKPTGESRLDDVAEIDLNFDCDGLEDGKSYTLAQLCGEEEKE